MFGRVFVAVIIALCGLGICVSGAEAQGTTTRIVVTFRLQVHGHPAPRTTFWVAYRSLAGTVGITQLHAAGQGLYVAHRPLPARGRTVVAYLAGTRSVVVPYGRAPGDPLTTIRSIGPIAMSQLNARVVQWDTPTG